MSETIIYHIDDSYDNPDWGGYNTVYIFTFPDGVTEGSPVTMWYEHEDVYYSSTSEHVDLQEQWARGVVVSFEGEKVCIDWGMVVQKRPSQDGGRKDVEGKWQQKEPEKAKTYSGLKKGNIFRIQAWHKKLQEKIAEADEFLAKCRSTLAILIGQVDLVGGLLHLTASTLGQEEFKVILKAGASVEDVAPEILKIAGHPEGTPLKLVMPDGNLLGAKDFLPASSEPSADVPSDMEVADCSLSSVMPPSEKNEAAHSAAMTMDSYAPAPPVMVNTPLDINVITREAEEARTSLGDPERHNGACALL